MSDPLHPRLWMGTSSWSASDWVGPFYPEGTESRDMLRFYATRFRTVELDASFYRCPSRDQTAHWARSVPDSFRLSAKVPQTITHEKMLIDVKEDFAAFLSAMDVLGDKLGVLVFQFPYFNKQAFKTADPFLERLEAFLPTLPKGYRFALEIRNKAWVAPRFLDALRKNNVAYVLIDHPWMHPIRQLMEKHDVVTSSFSYIRWLGDRHKIEETTKEWGKLVVDRAPEMKDWVPVVHQLLEKEIDVFAYFNNHYAGHAPGSIALFEEAWRETS